MGCKQYLVGTKGSMRWAFESELTSPALLAGLAAWNASLPEEKAQALMEVRAGLATATGDCINVERMEMAVRLVLPSELTKHSLSEGKKAVDKAGGNFTPLGMPLMLARSNLRARLVFPVAQAGAFATLMSGMIVEGSAAVFLAAVLEYMAAEIIELAGNACRDRKKTAVEPRHIMLAIGDDEQLDLLYLGHHVLPQTSNPKPNPPPPTPQIPDPRPKTPNPKPQTPQPTTHNPHPKPKIPNLQTPNHKP